MKIALCISGQTRNLNSTSDVVKLASKLNADVYVSTWKELGATSAYDRFFPSSSLARLIVGVNESGKYNYSINNFKLEFPSLYSLFYSKQYVDSIDFFGFFDKLIYLNVEEQEENFSITRRMKGVEFPEEILRLMPKRYLNSLPMFYKIYDADCARISYEKSNNFEYDIVIRARTDLIFDDLDEICEICKNKIHENVIYTTTNETIRNNNFFLNDSFAIGSSRSMSKYSCLFENLNDYWDVNKFLDFPLEKRAAESLLGFHVKFKEKIETLKIKSRINIDLSAVRFSIEEIFPRFLIDISLKAKITNNLEMAHGLMSKLFFEKKNIALDYFADLKDVSVKNVWLCAYVAKKRGDLSLALGIYDMAHNTFKGFDSRPSIEYCKTLVECGFYKKAISILNSLIESEDKNHILYREIANAYIKLIDKDRFFAKYYYDMAYSNLVMASSLSKTDKIVEKLFVELNGLK